jgi:hypothetical protein
MHIKYGGTSEKEAFWPILMKREKDIVSWSRNELAFSCDLESAQNLH